VQSGSAAPSCGRSDTQVVVIECGAEAISGGPFSWQIQCGGGGQRVQGGSMAPSHDIYVSNAEAMVGERG
jgi:hypothetical protein